MKMLSLEVGTTWSTVTLDCLYAESKCQKNSRSPQHHGHQCSRVHLKVKVMSTLCLCFEAKLVESKAEHEPSMILYGCSRTGDIKTAWPPLEMCCLVTCCQVLLGLLHGRCRDYIKRMITIMECDTPTSKDRWIGHPSIPPRMFGLKQYLVTPPVQKTKPRVTSKPLLALGSFQS